MPCPCKSDFERALVEMTTAQKPKASDVKARIEGYGLNLRTGEERPALVAVVPERRVFDMEAGVLNCQRCVRAIEAERKRLERAWEAGRLSTHPK